MIAKLNFPQVGLFILAWFFADLITPLIIRLSHRIGAVDRPHSYKIHTEPIPFLGGIAIYLAFSLALFTSLRFTGYVENRAMFSIIFGGFFIVVLGTIDCFRPISAVAKLLILCGVTWLISRFGVRINLFPNEWLDLALTVLWIAGVTSSMNSLDNMDGAAAGISAIAAFWTFYIAFYSYGVGQQGPSFVAVTLLGACIGFLRYNFKPARIFLGDNGSLLLGFLLASLMVLTAWSRTDRIKAIVVPCAILCVPLYDITLATILRIKNGVVKNLVEAIVYCGRDHLSHRLVALGLSQREAVMTLYLFGLMAGAVGMIIDRPEVGRATYLPILGVAAVALGVLGAILDRAKVYEKPGAPSPAAPAAARK